MPDALYLSGCVEAKIKTYAKERSEDALQRVWQALVGFWRAVGAAPFEVDADGDEVLDPGCAHYRLCYRLLITFKSVGFDAETPEGDRILNTASGRLVSYLNECNDKRDLFPWGEGGAAPGLGFVSVDLVRAQVIRSYAPITAEWSKPIRRADLKVGRNDPCPCGARIANKPIKHKKCCGAPGAARDAAVTTQASATP